MTRYSSPRTGSCQVSSGGASSKPVICTRGPYLPSSSVDDPAIGAGAGWGAGAAAGAGTGWDGAGGTSP